ncbi:MAG: phosphonoacetaldehyde hydrolase [Nanoarchaeota archaeon]
MAEKLEAVILDWAGTTMDHGCMAPAVVFQKVFAEAGVPITMEEARKPMGAHKKVHIRKITEDPAVRSRWEAQYGRKPAEEDVQKMFESFVPAQIKILPEYAALIPGTLEAIAKFRELGLKIGSTTGYTGDMMKVLMVEAEKQGYVPDVTVCASGHYAIRKDDRYEWGFMPDLKGRPERDMCDLNAELLGVSKPYLCAKIGDTIPDIQEGKRAGMWAIGLAKTGNEMGLTEAEVNVLSREDLSARLEEIRYRMVCANVDYNVNSISEVPRALEEINQRMAKFDHRPRF